MQQLSAHYAFWNSSYTVLRVFPGKLCANQPLCENHCVLRNHIVDAWNAQAWLWAAPSISYCLPPSPQSNAVAEDQPTEQFPNLGLRCKRLWYKWDNQGQNRVNEIVEPSLSQRPIDHYAKTFVARAIQIMCCHAQSQSLEFIFLMGVNQTWNSFNSIFGPRLLGHPSQHLISWQSPSLSQLCTPPGAAGAGLLPWPLAPGAHHRS